MKVKRRIEQLEAEQVATWVELHAVQDGFHQVGVTFDVEMSAGLAASYSLWKQHNAVTAGRELSRADWQAARAS
jgi:hypothetical protein